MQRSQQNLPLISMKSSLQPHNIKPNKRRNSQVSFHQNGGGKQKKNNRKHDSVGYPFIPKIKHKSRKELEIPEGLSKQIPFGHEVHRLYKYYYFYCFLVNFALDIS